MGIQELPPQSCYHLREADPSIPLLDVRTPEEFAAGHPEGALNVPNFLFAGGSRQPNPRFLEVAQALLPDKDARVIFTCATGVRSLRACEALAGLGYQATINLIGGLLGARGSGEPPGWREVGLPVSTQVDDRGWETLQAKLA